MYNQERRVWWFALWKGNDNLLLAIVGSREMRASSIVCLFLLEPATTSGLNAVEGKASATCVLIVLGKYRLSRHKSSHRPSGMARERTSPRTEESALLRFDKSSMYLVFFQQHLESSWSSSLVPVLLLLLVLPLSQQHDSLAVFDESHASSNKQSGRILWTLFNALMLELFPRSWCCSAAKSNAHWRAYVAG